MLKENSSTQLGARGKRAPVNHGARSASPRAVKARLQKQGPPSSGCCFAVTRRSVEYEGAQRVNGQDSWEPSSIEPLKSVGSGVESSNSDDTRAWLASQHGFLPTPVRSMSQASRGRMMRHSIENDGSDESDDEHEKETPGENISLPDTARTVFHKLQYPHQSTYESHGELARAHTSCGSFTNTALAMALSSAINDEYEALARAWGVGSPGQEKRVQDRVAQCLKKFAKRAEKTCMEALSSKKATTLGGENLGVEAQSLDKECMDLEAQIAATDKSISRIQESLSENSYSVKPDTHNIVTDLLDRLATNSDSEHIVAPHIVDFDNFMNDKVQGLVQRLIAVGSSCQEVPNGQKEARRSANAAICATSAANMPHAISTLKRLG